MKIDHDIAVSARSEQSDKLFISLLTDVCAVAWQVEDPQEAIRNILQLTGQALGFHHVYIMEDHSPAVIQNSYEWYAGETAPPTRIRQLSKEACSYDVIINSSIYCAEDIRQLPQAARELFEAQGVRALLILPLHYLERPLGYVSFIDLKAGRKWEDATVRILQGVAGIITSLLLRAGLAQREMRAREVLKTVAGSIDHAICVIRPDTREILYVNRTAIETLPTGDAEPVGKKCWAVLAKDQAGPCPLCPLPQMIGNDDRILQMTGTRELQNPYNKKWYLIRDTILHWFDGSAVHLATATEITQRGEFESRLKLLTSTDLLTRAWNRESGYRMLDGILLDPEHRKNLITLIYIDLDSLKEVNDLYGHDAGDLMLVEAVNLIRSGVRESDALFRWGGDEFILLLNCDLERASVVMGNILHKVNEFNWSNSHPWKLSFSYGMTDLFAADDETPDQLIAHADSLMQAQKAAKRHGWG